MFTSVTGVRTAKYHNSLDLQLRDMSSLSINEVDTTIQSQDKQVKSEYCINKVE